MRYSVFLGLTLIASLSGCAGTWVSGRPIYPAHWPTLNAACVCPDLSGKYRALSDEAAPLVYPPGRHPREMFFFIPYGAAIPLPPLGRRILPWHLAGAFKDSDHAVWNALTLYIKTLETETATTRPACESGWVEVTQLINNVIEIRAGLHDMILLRHKIKKEVQGKWMYRSHTYECKKGGLEIVGSFPPPPEENPSGQSIDVSAKFTFFRAVDGSLIALEEAYTGVTQGGNMIFNKWWRWRPIE